MGGRFGAEGVPVARLPAVRTWGAVDGSEVPVMVARHRTPLLAFGGALEALGRRFDVIHAHNGLPDGAAAVGLATALGVPLVVTEHDSTLPDRLRHSAAAAAYRELLAAGTVVAVSRALADRVDAALGSSGEGAHLRGVLPNVVPLARFAAPGPTDARDLDELLWVGARAQHKGFETLLRAVAEVRARRPALHLRAIGPSTPDDERRWQESIGALGISEAVELEAPASREEVAAAMRRAGLFVHPSPFETFGMVAAEALASGLPVAATPSGGVEEVLAGDPGRGEVADAASPEALGAAIERLRDRLDAIDRPTLRASIEVRYAPHVIATRTLALYEHAGSRTGDAPAMVTASGSRTTSDRRRGRGRKSSERRGSGRGSARWPAPGAPRPSRHRHGPPDPVTGTRDARPPHGTRRTPGPAVRPTPSRTPGASSGATTPEAASSSSRPTSRT